MWKRVKGGLWLEWSRCDSCISVETCGGNVKMFLVE